MSKLSRYINSCIIDEYAEKGHPDGYYLDVTKLPAHEINDFLNALMENDGAAREMILDRMQELVDSAIPFVESRDNFDAGFIPMHDPMTGEVSWIKGGVA